MWERHNLWQGIGTDNYTIQEITEIKNYTENWTIAKKSIINILGWKQEAMPLK